jgi:transposase
VTIKGKQYERHLLREAYRDAEGKPQKRTIANLGTLSDGEVAALKAAMKYKDRPEALAALDPNGVRLEHGLSVGAIDVLTRVSRRIGLDAILGEDRQGKLAMVQVLARLIDQGSRLSTVRLAKHHDFATGLGVKRFDEDDLYDNLDWIADNQARIEDALRQLSVGSRTSEVKSDVPSEVASSAATSQELFLYDVTSSYLEGEHNELAAWGYNRDGKPTKRQIVIGLLCDQQGTPLSVEVFPGNTSDPVTVSNQLSKLVERFGCNSVTLVGDRGMLKLPQRDALGKLGLHYITALTNQQVKTLINKDVLQLELFESELCEVIDDTEQGGDGQRYVLRCNPVRRDEIRRSRAERLERLRSKVDKANQYLAKHAKASAATWRENLLESIDGTSLDGWVTIEAVRHTLAIVVDHEALHEKEVLDGCYVLTTDLEPKTCPKEEVHRRYKDLALVERGFRTMKTAHLQLRPIHVRLASRTRGHVFVVMLAYLLQRELEMAWKGLDITVEEGLAALSQLCATVLIMPSVGRSSLVPMPRPNVLALYEALGLKPPAKWNEPAGKDPIPTKKS